MREDRQFKIRARNFISETLKDVRTSDKSVFRYFNPSFKNKRLFKYNAKWANLRPGHAGSLFGKDNKSQLRWNNLTEVMFGQMMREAKLRRVYLLMPNKEGEFRSSQKKLLTRFTDLILRKVDEREKLINENQASNKKLEKGKTRSRAEIDELANKTQKNLEKYGKLETVSPFQYNEKTGLIEGAVANILDPEGSSMKAKVDPENPDLILFSSTLLGVCFAMENNEKDLVLFANTATNDMLKNNQIESSEAIPEAEEMADEKDTLGLMDYETMEIDNDPESAEWMLEGMGNQAGINQKSEALLDDQFKALFGDQDQSFDNQLNQSIGNQETSRPFAKSSPVRFKRNLMFESRLKGEAPAVSTKITGADGQTRERVEEDKLKQKEQMEAQKKHLDKKEQAMMEEDAKKESEQQASQQTGGKKRKIGRWIFAAIIGGSVLFDII